MQGGGQGGENFSNLSAVMYHFLCVVKADCAVMKQCGLISIPTGSRPVGMIDEFERNDPHFSRYIVVQCCSFRKHCSKLGKTSKAMVVKVATLLSEAATK